MKKTKMITLILLLVVLSALLMFFCKCVCLSPWCFADNKNLTDEENEIIKETVLEKVKQHLSVFSKEENEQNRVLIFIDGNFMNTVKKEETGYKVRVQTYGMEEVSYDCVYEIYVSKDFSISFFGIDP